jgi:tRNA(Ile)-lysidine synthase
MNTAETVFDRLDLSGTGPVTVAYSGGGDSTALLIVFSEWVRRHAPETRIVAVTVDHRLRPESGAEAERAGELCAKLGIAHRIVAWTGERPATGVQNAARAARYRLLGDAARQSGSRIVLAGHTRDDQRETVLMRGARGQGRGLAGIAAATLAFDPSGTGEAVWFVRPLLGESRASLRALLRRRGIGWSEDPSNENQFFERVRARGRLSDMPAGEVEALDRAAAEASERRFHLTAQAARLVAVHFSRTPQGLITAKSQFREICASDAGVHALGAMLAFVGECDQMPPAARVRAVCEALGREAAGKVSLARCVIDARKSGIAIYRERRGLRRGDGAFNAPVRPHCLWPWPDIVPEFDFVLAQSIARLAGMAGLPDPPWRR